MEQTKPLLLALVKGGFRVLPELFRAGSPPAYERSPAAVPVIEEPPLDAIETTPVTTRGDIDPETMDYQLREVYDELWLAEGHAKQDFLGCGADVDCGFKHGMNLVALAKETKSMTTEPIWDEIEKLGKDLQVQAHPDRVKEQAHHQEYQQMAIRISGHRRAIQKTIIARQKGDLSLEEAKRLACEEARQEVERRW